MWNLIKKDIIFNKRYIFLVSIFFFAVGSYVIKEKSVNFTTVMMGCFVQTMAFFLAVVPKSCFQEEKNNAISYIKSLPVERHHIVLSKYIESTGCILIGNGISLTILYFMNVLNYINLEFEVILLSTLIIYSSIYLFTSFRFGFMVSQIMVYVLVGITIALLKIFQGLNLTWGDQEVYGLAAISLVILALCYLFSVKSFNKD